MNISVLKQEERGSAWAWQGPEDHLAQSSKNSSRSAEANTHRKAFTRARVTATYLPASEHRTKGIQVGSAAPLQPSHAAHPPSAAQCKHQVCSWKHGMWGIESYLPHRSSPRQAACSWEAAFPTPAFHLTATLRRMPLLQYKAVQSSSWPSQMAGRGANYPLVVTTLYLDA